jgi:hypothetical protein
MCADPKMKMAKGSLDIENSYEKTTPFMLAVLREDYETADLLKQFGLCNPDHTNVDGKNVSKLCTAYKLPGPCEYMGAPCPYIPSNVKFQNKPDTFKIGQFT